MIEVDSSLPEIVAGHFGAIGFRLNGVLGCASGDGHGVEQIHTFHHSQGRAPYRGGGFVGEFRDLAHFS